MAWRRLSQRHTPAERAALAPVHQRHVRNVRERAATAQINDCRLRHDADALQQGAYLFRLTSSVCPSNGLPGHLVPTISRLPRVTAKLTSTPDSMAS